MKINTKEVVQSWIKHMPQPINNNTCSGLFFYGLHHALQHHTRPTVTPQALASVSTPLATVVLRMFPTDTHQSHYCM